MTSFCMCVCEKKLVFSQYILCIAKSYTLKHVREIWLFITLSPGVLVTIAWKCG